MNEETKLRHFWRRADQGWRYTFCASVGAVVTLLLGSIPPSEPLSTVEFFLFAICVTSRLWYCLAVQSIVEYKYPSWAAKEREAVE